MKKGECKECGKPLFDQSNNEPEQLFQQLCDECYKEQKDDERWILSQ